MIPHHLQSSFQIAHPDTPTPTLLDTAIHRCTRVSPGPRIGCRPGSPSRPHTMTGWNLGGSPARLPPRCARNPKGPTMSDPAGATADTETHPMSAVPVSSTDLNTDYGAFIKLRPEHPLTDVVKAARHDFAKMTHAAPPLFLCMHTATLGALLAEWNCLDPEASLENNYLFGLLCTPDDTMALGMIRASR